MKNLLTTLLLCGVCLLLISCRKGMPPGETAEPVQRPEGIWEVDFRYDMYSGERFALEAKITDITPEGSRLQIEKRVGPMNYTGHSNRESWTWMRSILPLFWRF